MSETKLLISGMTCGHCVAAVTKALQSVAGVQTVEVSLEHNQAAVQGTAPLSRLVDVVRAQGYGAEILP